LKVSISADSCRVRIYSLLAQPQKLCDALRAQIIAVFRHGFRPNLSV
jgi:hypothetical protein